MAYILTEFEGDSRADYAVASYALSECCEKFPTYRILSKYLSNLYDASLSSNTGNIFSCCDRRMSYIGGVILDDRYALDGEKLEAEFSELICECLTKPLAANGAFDENITTLMKAELIDTIDSVINEKSSYAAKNAAKTAYIGEPAELPAYGTREEALQVTPKTAFSAYKKMLETGHIEIVAAGCSDFSDAERIFTKALSGLSRSSRNIKPISASKPSPLKETPAYASDTLQMQQAILRMYFKAPELSDHYADKLFTMILGGMTTSRFFSNIREKQSLCYYCGCFSNRYKRVLTVNAGVEPQNLKRTEQAVLHELNEIQENGITEEEVRSALLEAENQLEMMKDSTAVSGWYLDQITEDKILSPEEYLAELKKVTPERIREAARLYRLDTVYALSGEDLL